MPTALFLYDDLNAVNVPEASHLWLAPTLGLRTILATWRGVQVEAKGTTITEGVEVVSQENVVRLSAPIRIDPSLIIHRTLVDAPAESLLTDLARVHPMALLSFARPWRTISAKWSSELCLRDGERAAVRVARPATYLVPKQQIKSALKPLARTRPLIFKPSSGSLCLGIRVSTPRTFDAVADEISTSSSWERYVVQELVTDPILYKGRKFDLRIYALVTSFRPLRWQLLREGVARIAAHPFNKDGVEDCLSTLTGSSFRKRQGVVVENIAVSELLAHLQREGRPVDDFWSRMETLLQDVFACFAGSPAMAKVPHLGRCVYLAGLDVLMTIRNGALKLLFIETNYVPQLTGWGRGVDQKLQAVHRTWLGHLRATHSRGAA